MPYSLSLTLKLIRTLPASAGDEHRALHAWSCRYLGTVELARLSSLTDRRLRERTP